MLPSFAHKPFRSQPGIWYFLHCRTATELSVNPNKIWLNHLADKEWLHCHIHYLLNPFMLDCLLLWVNEICKYRYPSPPIFTARLLMHKVCSWCLLPFQLRAQCLLSLFVQVPERECCWGSLCCCGFSCGFKPLTHDWAVCFTGGFPLQTTETEVSGCCYTLCN